MLLTLLFLLLQDNQGERRDDRDRRGDERERRDDRRGGDDRRDRRPQNN